MKQSLAKMLILLLALPGMALGHTSVETAGFMHGFGHPVGGADHLLAMLAVGLWAAQIGGRALWVVPGTFVGVMILGSFLGGAGVSVPFVEEGVLVSLLLGVLIAGALRFPLRYSALIVGCFAVLHGHAHGAGMPAMDSAGSYIAGFAVATAMLHAAGIGLGILMRTKNLPAATRLAGSAIALSGIYLAIS